MLNKIEAYKVIDRIVRMAGNYEVLVTIQSQEVGLTRFANSEIHQNVLKEDMEVEIELREGKKKAKVVVNQVDGESLEQAVAEAAANLQVVPESKLAVPLIAGPEEISAETVDPRLAEDFAIRERAELVGSGIGMLAEEYQAAGSLSLEKLGLALGNSRGIKRYFRSDQVSFNVVVFHEDGATGYAELKSDSTDDIYIPGLFQKAYDKARLALNPVSLEPGPYTVILEPLAVGDLLSYMSYVGFSGKSVQDKRSFLSGKIGEQVFGRNITIHDDVENPNTVQLPFDFEGARRKPLRIIEKGVARELAYDLSSAIKAGVETTGHSIGSAAMGGFPVNLVMANGEDSLEDLVSRTDRGILVTRFHYMNIVNPRQAVLTGLTRDGTFLIEDGKIKSGIKNLRFTESMLEAFNRVTGISRERQKVPHFFAVSYVPALKIEDFHFTGKTEIKS